MGTWRGLRVAFVLGSLFMILLIIVYWDDVGGFNLYPLQEHRHESPHSDTSLLVTTGPSPPTSFSRAQTSSSFNVLTTVSGKTQVSDETGGAAEDHAEEEKGRDKQEPMKEETRENVEREWSHAAVGDEKQEVRKKRIMDMCSGKDAVEFPGRTRAFEQIPNRELDHLIVDDTHQIIYCYVPKVQLPFFSVCERVGGELEK